MGCEVQGRGVEEFWGFVCGLGWVELSCRGVVVVAEDHQHHLLLSCIQRIIRAERRTKMGIMVFFTPAPGDAWS